MTDNTVLLGVVTPIAALMVVYFAYALIVFRRARRRARRGGGDPGDRAHPDDLAGDDLGDRALAGGLTAPSGSSTTGAGGGRARTRSPSRRGDQLQVQVIGQQWEFTYRYPVLRRRRDARIWCCRLTGTSSSTSPRSTWSTRSGPTTSGVKADANPGVDNVVYVRPTKIRSFDHPLRRALRAVPRAHVRHRPGGERRRASLAWIHGQQRVLRPCDGGPAPVQHPLQPGSPQEGRMNAEPNRPPALARPARLQPPHRDRPGGRRLLLRLVAGPPDPRPEPRLLRRHRARTTSP